MCLHLQYYAQVNMEDNVNQTPKRKKKFEQRTSTPLNIQSEKNEDKL